jgi:hypothetical protein
VEPVEAIRYLILIGMGLAAFFFVVLPIGTCPHCNHCREEKRRKKEDIANRKEAEARQFHENWHRGEQRNRACPWCKEEGDASSPSSSTKEE